MSVKTITNYIDEIMQEIGNLTSVIITLHDIFNIKLIYKNSYFILKSIKIYIRSIEYSGKEYILEDEKLFRKINKIYKFVYTYNDDEFDKFKKDILDKFNNKSISNKLTNVPNNVLREEICSILDPKSIANFSKVCKTFKTPALNALKQKNKDVRVVIDFLKKCQTIRKNINNDVKGINCIQLFLPRLEILAGIDAQAYSQYGQLWNFREHYLKDHTHYQHIKEKYDDYILYFIYKDENNKILKIDKYYEHSILENNYTISNYLDDLNKNLQTKSISLHFNNIFKKDGTKFDSSEYNARSIFEINGFYKPEPEIHIHKYINTPIYNDSYFNKFENIFKNIFNYLTNSKTGGLSYKFLERRIINGKNKNIYTLNKKFYIKSNKQFIHI
jgi:hypothetical protein